MDYFKIYKKLVDSRKPRGTTRQTGYELHHIVPRCLGGTDSEENLVLLTYKEHYVAHHLLTKMHPLEPKIHYAFLCMLRDPHGNRILTAKMVETIKLNFSKFKSWHIKMNNPMFRKEAKDKISKRMKENNPNKGGSSNHTSYPVRIWYEDGTRKDFEYMKQASEMMGYPYSSLKQAHRNGKKMKKYKIEKIEKIACEG